MKRGDKEEMTEENTIHKRSYSKSEEITNNT